MVNLLFWSSYWFNLLMRSNETNYYMQTYLHLLTSLKCFGRYTQTVRYTLRERKFQGTKIPRSESSIELSFPGAKRPGSKRAREQKFQGANWPGSYWPIRSRERIGLGAKRLGTPYHTRPAAPESEADAIKASTTDSCLWHVCICLWQC